MGVEWSTAYGMLFGCLIFLKAIQSSFVSPCECLHQVGSFQGTGRYFPIIKGVADALAYITNIDMDIMYTYLCGGFPLNIYLLLNLKDALVSWGTGSHSNHAFCLISNKQVNLQSVLIGHSHQQYARVAAVQYSGSSYHCFSFFILPNSVDEYLKL